MDSMIYKGNEKYIFVSYSHKDKEIVIPILKILSNSGYRIWFDEGIEISKSWDDYIATHIQDCTFFLSFISNNYLASENCKDEINYARDLEKECLIIYLEDVSFPPGMAMRLNRIQAINYYSISKERMFEKIYESENVSKCKNTNTNLKSKDRIKNESDPSLRKNKPSILKKDKPKRFLSKLRSIIFVLLIFGILALYMNVPHTIDPFDPLYFNVDSSKEGVHLEYVGIAPDGYFTIKNTIKSDDYLGQFEYSIPNPYISKDGKIEVVAKKKDGTQSETKLVKVDAIPHYLANASDLDQKSLKHIMDRMYNYGSKKEQVPIIYKNGHSYLCQKYEQTFYAINKSAYLFVNEETNRNVLIIFEDVALDCSEMIDTDTSEKKSGFYNTLIGVYLLENITVDENGNVDFEDNSHLLPFQGYYLNDEDLNNDFLDAYSTMLTGKGYKFSRIILK